METRITGVLFFLFFSSLWAQEVSSPVPDTGQAQNQGTAQGVLGVEEVKAKALLRIEDAQKPPLEATPDPWSPIDSVLRQRERTVTLEANPLVEQALNRSVKSVSPVLKVPIFHPKIQQSVRIPIPTHLQKMGQVARWRMEIVNSMGIPVQTLEGKGRIPDAVEWDGAIGTQGWLIPGEPYGYRLTVFTKDGASRTFLGKAFKVPALKMSGSEGVRVRVALSELFVPGTATLTPKGDTLLHEIWNILKDRWGRGFALRLYMKDPVLMAARQKVIQRHLQEHMAVDPASVNFEPHPLTGNPIYEMMEVVVP